MLERRVTVTVAEGLHARPAAGFVKLARGFACRVEIERGGRTADAKSAVKLMLLGVLQGDDVALRADGPDEVEALRALADFVAGGGERARLPESAPSAPAAADAHHAPTSDGAILRGAGVGDGAVVGPAHPHFAATISAAERVAAGGADIEAARVASGLATARAWIAARAAGAAAGSAEAEILAAMAEIGADADVEGRIVASARAGRGAVDAALSAGEALGAEFAALADPYLRARGEDVRAFARAVALAILGRRDPDLAEAPAGAVVTAEDLSALDLAGAPLGALGGLVCATGSATSHVAIIARAHGLPAVLGVAGAGARLAAAKVVALDAAAGEVAFDPDPALADDFARRAAGHRARKAELAAYATIDPVTRDGRRIVVAANLGSLDEIEAAKAAGAHGVGLFRTEFLFMRGRRPPSEDEQAAVYATLCAAFAPADVVVRTLDVGGDKPAPGIDFVDEDNPFLGWRGVRLCLDRPDIFKPQLRALLRAATAGNLKVMAPMVSEPEEMRAVRALMAQCRAELAAEGVAHGDPALGAMVETPAAALTADALARESAFFSIGTNDLTQYVMAADRTNARVARLNRAEHPAALAAVRLACEAGARAGVPVTICGEAAARPDLIPVYVGMGAGELSMSASSIPMAKKCIVAI